MPLPEKIKTVTEMKSLQAEEKAVQVQKIARQAQLEPLQEKVEQLVMEIDAEKLNIEQIGLEGGEILKTSSHRTDGRSHGRKEKPGSEINANK
jgi:predicted  nucleic acid-binding Zn-ribbon protein